METKRKRPGERGREEEEEIEKALVTTCVEELPATVRPRPPRLKEKMNPLILAVSASQHNSQKKEQKNHCTNMP
jgi:hypothetical protein